MKRFFIVLLFGMFFLSGCRQSSVTTNNSSDSAQTTISPPVVNTEPTLTPSPLETPTLSPTEIIPITAEPVIPSPASEIISGNMDIEGEDFSPETDEMSSLRYYLLQNPNEFPIIGYEKETEIVLQILHKYFLEQEEVTIQEECEERSNVWKKLANKQVDIAFTMRPNSEKDIELLNKIGSGFEIIPILNLDSNIDDPNHRYYWYLYDGEEVFLDENSIIYAIIREDTNKDSVAGKMFNWTASPEAREIFCKNIECSYIASKSHLYDGTVWDITIEDYEPYKFDEEKYNEWGPFTYYVESINYVPGSVKEVSYQIGHDNDGLLRLAGENRAEYKKMEDKFNEINRQYMDKQDEVEICRNNYISAVGSLGLHYNEEEKYIRNIDYPTLEVYRSDDIVLSVLYNGVLHCSSVRSVREVYRDFGSVSYNIDPKTGQEIFISDICSDINLFATAAANELMRDYPNETFDALEGKIYDLIINNRLIWLFDNEGITIRVAGDEIGSDSYSIYETTVMAKENGNVFDEKLFPNRYMTGFFRNIAVSKANGGASGKKRLSLKGKEDERGYARYCLKIDGEEYMLDVPYKSEYQLKKSYLVCTGDKYYLYIDLNLNDDDYDICIYQIWPDKEPEEIGWLYNYGFDGCGEEYDGEHKNIDVVANIDNFSLFSRHDIMGTHKYYGKPYTVGDDGIPITSDKYYPIDRKLALKHNCRFSLYAPEKDKVIGTRVYPRGTAFYLRQTDGYKYVDLESEDGTWIRMDGKKYYHFNENEYSEDDIFDGIMYFD